MLDIKDFHVGDHLYVPIVDNAGRYTGDIVTETISKVGRKYITVGDVVTYKLLPSAIKECFELQSEEGYADFFFPTVAQAEEEIKRDELWREVQQRLRSPITDTQLAEIAAILGIEK